MQGPTAKQRSPGLSLFLFVVTLGVYWFVWLYKTFREVANHRGQPWRPDGFIAAIAGLFLASIAAAIVMGVFLEPTATETRSPEDLRLEDIWADEPLIAHPIGHPVWLTAAAILVLGVALAIVQLLFVRQATELVNGAIQSAGRTDLVAPLLAMFFNVMLALGQLPIVGGIFELVALILAIVWVVKIQGRINWYWQSVASAAPGVPSPFPGAPTMAGAGQPVAPLRGAPEPPSFRSTAPPPAQMKAFACPTCGTHINIPYTPGAANPIDCPSCGTKGTVS